MKALSMILVVSLSLFLMACDAHDNVNRPKAEMRTMIIGGVPVNDADFQLSVRQNSNIKPVVIEKTEK